MPLSNESTYTINDIYALPEGERAELIDGKLYMMAPPSRLHQELVGELFTVIRNHIGKNGGSCKAYIAPFAIVSSRDFSSFSIIGEAASSFGSFFPFSLFSSFSVFSFSSLFSVLFSAVFPAPDASG